MRTRSMSIYAESEEDYNMQYNEIRRRKRLSHDDMHNNQNEEDDYSTLTGYSPQSQQSTLSLYMGNPSYDGDPCEEETNNEDDFILKVEEQNDPHKKEGGISLLCEFLHKTLRNSSKGSSKLLFKKQSSLPSVMSQNAIYSIDTNQIISSLLCACDSPSCNEDDEVKYEKIILMMISNISTEKNKMLTNLINSSSSTTTTITPRYFDIINYHISLFNRNVMLEFFNTEEPFHFCNNKMAEVYYTLSHSYLFIIDSSLNKTVKFLEETYRRIAPYAMNKTLVLLDTNSIKGNKFAKIRNKIKAISEGYGMIYLSLEANEFTIQNEIIQNLFTLIFIKKIKTKAKGNNNNNDTSNNANNTNENTHSPPEMKNMEQNSKSNVSTNDSMTKNVDNSLGFNASYRLNHLNAFDFNDSPPIKRRFNEV